MTKLHPDAQKFRHRMHYEFRKWRTIHLARGEWRVDDRPRHADKLGNAPMDTKITYYNGFNSQKEANNFRLDLSISEALRRHARKVHRVLDNSERLSKVMIDALRCLPCAAKALDGRTVAALKKRGLIQRKGTVPNPYMPAHPLVAYRLTPKGQLALDSQKELPR